MVELTKNGGINTFPYFTKEFQLAMIISFGLMFMVQCATSIFIFVKAGHLLGKKSKFWIILNLIFAWLQAIFWTVFSVSWEK